MPQRPCLPATLLAWAYAKPFAGAAAVRWAAGCAFENIRLLVLGAIRRVRRQTGCRWSRSDWAWIGVYEDRSTACAFPCRIQGAQWRSGTSRGFPTLGASLGSVAKLYVRGAVSKYWNYQNRSSWKFGGRLRCPVFLCFISLPVFWWPLVHTAHESYIERRRDMQATAPTLWENKLYYEI